MKKFKVKFCIILILYEKFGQFTGKTQHGPIHAEEL